MHLIAHGGAGSQPGEPAERQAALEAAVDRGSEAETPLAAICRTVRVMETDPRFNAGVGGAVQSDGTVRTDAGVMRDDGTAGAAAAMPDVEHAVDVARAVAVETPHVLLAGEKAVAFARSAGVDTGCDLLTRETRERFHSDYCSDLPVRPHAVVRSIRNRPTIITIRRPTHPEAASTTSSRGSAVDSGPAATTGGRTPTTTTPWAR